MSASDTENGRIDIYPSERPTGWGVMAQAFVHEVAHSISFEYYGLPPYAASDWQPWADAIAKDGAAVSMYAMTDRGEDFAETMSVYMQVLGKPAEAQVRAIFPNRFSLLDNIMRKLASRVG